MDTRNHADVQGKIATHLEALSQRAVASLTDEEKETLKDRFCQYVRPVDDVEQTVLNQAFSEWVLFDSSYDFVMADGDEFVHELAMTEHFARFAISDVDETAGTCTLADTETGEAHRTYAPRITGRRSWRKGTVECRIAEVDGTWYLVGLSTFYDRCPAGRAPALPGPLHGSMLLACAVDVMGEDGRFSDTLRPVGE